MGMDSKGTKIGRRAFTLVELLVVVSIIALLLASLLPSLKKARAQARSIRCGTNLHMFSHALQLYAGEYDGWIPRDRHPLAVPYAIGLARMLGYSIDEPAGGSTAEISDQWRDIEDQMRAVPMFQCPDFPMDNIVRDAPLPSFQPDLGGGLLPDQPLDYVVNSFSTGYSPEEEDGPLDAPDLKARWKSASRASDDTAPPMKLSQIRNASSRIYLSEAHRLLTTVASFPFHDVWRGSHLPRGRYPRVATDVRHPGGINSVYFDCHVERTLPANMDHRHWYGTPAEHALASDDF